MLLSRATPTLSGQQVGSFTTVAAATLTAGTGVITGVAHLTTIMGTGISDSLVLSSATTAASAAAVSNIWSGCVHNSGGVVTGTLAVSNLNVLGTFTAGGNVAIGKGTATYALDVSGAVSATSFVGSGALLTGIASGGGGGMFKNLVINGDMMINQYITSLSIGNDSRSASTGSSQSLCTYVADRFCVFRDSYAIGCTVVNDFMDNVVDYPYTNTIVTASSQLPFSDSGLKYFSIISRDNGNTSTANLNVRYAFELSDAYQLYGKTVTLSFYYLTGATFSGTALNYGLIMGAGEGLQRGAVSVTSSQSTTAPPSTTWTRASFTTTLPSITTTNMYLGLFFSYTPTGTSVGTDYFYITGVQLEKGSTATSFEYCPYATKLNLCQRYYKPINYKDYVVGMNTNSGNAIFPITLGIPMRIPPSTLITSGTIKMDAYGTTSTISALTINTGTTSTCTITATCAALATNTGPLRLTMFANAYMAVSAEM